VVEVVPVFDHVLPGRAIFLGAGALADEVQRDGFAALAGSFRPGDEDVDLVGKNFEGEVGQGRAFANRFVEAAVVDLLQKIDANLKINKGYFALVKI